MPFGKKKPLAKKVLSSTKKKKAFGPKKYFKVQKTQNALWQKNTDHSHT